MTSGLLHFPDPSVQDASESAADVSDRAPVDQSERERAVDPTESFVVQAPAGSGKTTLLVERFLRLLPTVEEPDEVLAITFTRAAAAHMRARIHAALRRAADGTPAGDASEKRIAEAAAAALAWSQRRGWNLLDEPQQLNVQTIDSLALTIAQQTPLTSRLGHGFAPTENAKSFYKRAAMRTMQSLEDVHSDNGPRRQTAEAAATLLRHRDNRLQQCADLLADMLQHRDQWGRIFPPGNSLSDEALDTELRPRLEGFLKVAVEEHLHRLSELLRDDNAMCREMVRLARFAANLATGEIANCRGLLAMPGVCSDDLPTWRGLAELVFTDTGAGRKAFQVGQGFLPGGISKSEKEDARALAEQVCSNEKLWQALSAVRGLPHATYSDTEWVVAKALLRLLHRGAVELKLLFADSGLVDFTEVGLAAIDALIADGQSGADRDTLHPSELGFALGARYRHLLVDELQDTSRTHVELLQLLTNQWQPGDGRTLFCVGDPMQSIYLFRQADLSLFSQIRDLGMAQMRPLALTLKVNFRSQRGLVEEHNRVFKEVFAQQTDVEFVPSQAFEGEARKTPVTWYFFPKEKKVVGEPPEHNAKDDEADRVVDIIADALAEDRKTRGAEDDKVKVAVLVRVKNHASTIMRLLRAKKIKYRAVDMESLADRQEVLDVFAVTRALLHPADRVAWLSVLRGPWCGLSLAGLDALAGERSHATVGELMATRLDHLAGPERTRVQRVSQVFEEAVASRDALRLPTLVWNTWRALGGEACVNAEQLANVTAYFALLEKMDAEGRPFRCDTIDDEIKRLCAQPDPDASIQVELMTIHKAKGQEWDVVVVPQMERPPYRGDYVALDWIEEGAAEDGALYLAPIPAVGEKKSALKEWICRKKKDREHAEVNRLLYVAATRAKSALHLLGSVEVKADHTLGRPLAGTLLNAAWCVAQEEAARQLVAPAKPQRLLIGTMAASQDKQPIVRLPDTWFASQAVLRGAATERTARAAGTVSPRSKGALDTFAGMETRIAGIALHRMLEAAAVRRASNQSWESLGKWAGESAPRLRRLLLGSGMPASRADGQAANILSLLQKALAGENGRWVLENHAGARNEFSLTLGDLEGATDLRLDRVFPAGSAPRSAGDSHLWIVDYKSAAVGGRDIAAFLSGQHEAYAERMSIYATSLRAALREARPVVSALYFPAMDLVHIVSELD